MPLQVIGAGQSRTGTQSLQLALEILGYRVQHGFQFLGDPNFDVAKLSRILQQQTNNQEDDDLESIFGPYDVALDWPSCGIYEQLMNRYPDSKVILTVRSAESWYDSYVSLQKPIFEQGAALRSQGQVVPDRIQQVFKFWSDSFLGGGVVKNMDDLSMLINDRERICRLYEEHNERVKRTVAPDRLLVLQMGDYSWEPLCKFLNKPVPQGVPFPHVGHRNEFSNNFWAAVKSGAPVA